MNSNSSDYQRERAFSAFFNNKGFVAPMAEKSVTNFETIQKNPQNLIHRLHYFAIGHKFKDMKFSIVFQNYFDEKQQEVMCHQYGLLTEEHFNFKNELYQLLKNIRNLNSHYVHTFDKLAVDDKHQKITAFLKESFKLATTLVFFEEKNIWKKMEEEIITAIFHKNHTADDFNAALIKKYNEYINSDKFKDNYRTFLKEKFFPFDEKKALSDEAKEKAAPYIELRNNFAKLTLDECISHLLFVEVSEDAKWNLYGDHDVIDIKKGTYFSFIATLFLLSLFLYKSEANQLISKIKGFKRNDDNKMRSKREIMTFFSKKMSSQDYNSEEKHLIFFRDIMQYLSKYPVAWNKELETDSAENETMSSALKDAVVHMEIDRLFPTMVNNDDFRRYAFEYFRQGNKQAIPSYPIFKDIIEKNDTVREIYEEIESKRFQPKKYKSGKFSMYALKYVVRTYFPNDNQFRQYEKENFYPRHEESFKKELRTNSDVEKFKKRLDEKTLFTSFGRNQDRFIAFAARYLAENHYFGKDAKFKLYQFFTTDEQNRYLEKKEKEISKKDFDKLKFHDGKLIHYAAYEAHLRNYPEWDMPFVVENNAIQVKVTLNESVGETILSLQRELVVYLLQDALYAEKPQNAGIILFKKYYADFYKSSFNNIITTLRTEEKITTSQKTDFRKLVPRRLLKHYHPSASKVSEQEDDNGLHSLREILTKTQRQEKRYQDLVDYKYETAQSNGYEVYENFIQKNKGKQFKLMFIRKAWHIMYFKDIYTKYASEGHHKRLHITRDEFNDFCRYMFAFDVVPQYKFLLYDLLNSKHFFENKTFETLFGNGKSLEDFYIKTKENFSKWIDQADAQAHNPDKYRLDNYKTLLSADILYINLSHFIQYLKTENKLAQNAQGHYIYRALENDARLIQPYYYKHAIEKDEYRVKSQAKLFNKLRTARLEDCLLYETAIKYLKKDARTSQALKNDVLKILNQPLVFDVKDKHGKELYKLQIPFKQVEKYVGMIKHKESKEQSHTSFMAEIPQYIEKAKEEKEIIPVWNNYRRNGMLTLDDVAKVQAHIVSQAEKFTQLTMEMEKYFVYQDKITMTKTTHVEYDEIPSLAVYFDKDVRNNAYHFGIPDETYVSKLKKIEEAFIKNRLNKDALKGYNDIPAPEKQIMNIFLETINHSLFNQSERDKKKRIESAQLTYYEKIIRKV